MLGPQTSKAVIVCVDIHLWFPQQTSFNMGIPSIEYFQCSRFMWPCKVTCAQTGCIMEAWPHNYIHMKSASEFCENTYNPLYNKHLRLVSKRCSTFTSESDPFDSTSQATRLYLCPGTRELMVVLAVREFGPILYATASPPSPLPSLHCTRQPRHVFPVARWQVTDAVVVPGSIVTDCTSVVTACQ